MLEKRLNYFALVGVVAGLGLSGCGEKKEEATNTGGGGDAGAGSGGAEEVVVPEATPDARAAALGYAQYLPKETQAFFGVFDGKGWVNEMRASKLGVYLEAQAAEVGMNLDEVNEDPQAGMMLSLFAEEFFIAVGKGTPTQADNLTRIGESMNFHQMKMMVSMVDTELGGDGGGMREDQMAMAMIKGIVEDPRGGIAVLEGSQMPPLTLGAKVSDAEQREQLVGMMAGGMAEMLAEIGPDGAGFAEAVEAKRGDATFTGVRIMGDKLVALMDDSDKEEMSEVFGAANVEKIIKAASAKNLVFAVGDHAGYVVLFAGSDVEELQVAASPSDSYAASGDVAFVDGHLGKKPLMVTSISDALLNGLVKNSTWLGSLAQGVKSGLADTKNLGDTRDMEVLLDLLIKQEKELMGLFDYEATGIAVVRDEGLKMEFYGGHNAPNLDLKSGRNYASLGEREGVFMFSNWIGNEDYSDKAFEYLDTVGEIGYLAASRASKLDISDPDFEQFKEGFGMFDTMIKADLLELWGAVRGDLGDGLGGEGAFIIDMKGALPTVPGIPQVIADEGKAPRIGFVKPVEDREKISSSWKRINGAAENILKTISEMSGENIPMQKPMSSEKDDLQTWFMVIPFQNDDFVPSVSVDDQNFFLSTSKSFVQDMSASLKDSGDAGAAGAYSVIDLNVLRDYIGEWIALVDKNAEELFGGPDGAAGFRGELPKVREAISATSDLDTITMRTRMVNGKLRSTLHFKVK